MKTLTKFFFCMFVLFYCISCVPEEIPQFSKNEVISPIVKEPVSDTGDQNDDIDDDMKGA